MNSLFGIIAGGMVLHKGEIAEMRTGEGKTLVAILPAYLNALSGKGVHVVTVNDYLARRDCEWVGQVPRFLGLKVGLIQRMSLSLNFLLNVITIFFVSCVLFSLFVDASRIFFHFYREYDARTKEGKLFIRHYVCHQQ